MEYEKICKLLNYNHKESQLYMPNEVFNDLKTHIKNAPHIGFAYSYLYLTYWLWRHAKYFNVSTILDNSKVKEVLGYSATTKTLSYLIKKDGGLLDKMGYTESSRDYPISWEYLTGEELEFEMSSDYGEFSVFLPTIPKRFFLKKPLKGYTRVLMDEHGEEYEMAGSFYDVSNTHCIPFEVFMYCMSNEDIGCTGFYLYCYLKHMNDIHEGGEYDVPLVKLSKETGISESNLDKYLGLLKSYRMIDFRHNQEFFAIGMKEEDRKANSYFANGYDFFGDEPAPFNKIEIMKKQDYFNMLKQIEESNKVDFNLEELPF